MNELYKRLREARKAKGLTQEELSEKADISRVMVSRYETGAVIPTVDVLVSLADALNVSTDYLLGRSGHAPHAKETLPSRPKAAPPEHSQTQSDLPKNKDELREFVMDVLKDCILLDF